MTDTIRGACLHGDAIYDLIRLVWKDELLPDAPIPRSDGGINVRVVASQFSEARRYVEEAAVRY